MDRQPPGSAGRSSEALLAWPGEKPFSSGSAGISRGMIYHNNNVYLVIDESLVQIGPSGSRSTVGTIPGEGRCSLATDGTNLTIRNGIKTYNYTTSLAEVTDTDLENAQTVTYINNQAIYQGTGNRYGVADPGNPTTINSLNYGSAESVGDDLVQVYAFNERLYLAGTNSIEIWYNTGTGTPPFDRIQQSTSQVGVASPFTIGNSEDYIYFLGSDNIAYRMSSYQPESITPSTIAKEFREADTSDAQGYVVKLEGQTFYIVQLPTSGVTLAYSEATQEWIRLASGVSTPFGRHLMNGYVYAWGKHLVSDYDSGDVYEWDFDTFQSNTGTIIRQRDSATIGAEKVGAPGNRLAMSKAEFIVETGVGNSNVENPVAMISASYDGGRSFTNEDWIPLGRIGETRRRVEWYNMATFYDIIIRFRVSDPAFIAIHSAFIDLDVAGW